MTHTIHIATASDDTYFEGLIVCLCSAATYLNKAKKCTFHVLDGGISIKNLDLLRIALAHIRPDICLNIHKLSLPKLDFAHVAEFHNGPMTYARLLLPELIPEVKKVLYIDADILVTKDLSKIFNFNFDNNSIAIATPDNVVDKLKDDCPWNISAEDSELTYFNAGFMLINLSRWRTDQITEKTLRLIQKEPKSCTYWDQTALNFILRNRVQLTDTTWNRDARSITMDSFALEGFNYHFITKSKPWKVRGPQLPFLYFRSWLSRIYERFSSLPYSTKSISMSPPELITRHKRIRLFIRMAFLRITGQRILLSSYATRIEADKSVRQQMATYLEHEAIFSQKIDAYIETILGSEKDSSSYETTTHCS